MTTLEMNTTKERPILFSGEMVRAILDGRKTQTRRVLHQPHRKDGAQLLPELLQSIGVGHACPHGAVGDYLWVREMCATDDNKTAWYRADGETHNAGLPWRSPIFMPRWASRITLEITGVRVERVQDISTADILAEGVQVIYSNGDCQINTVDGVFTGSATWCYQSLWDSINDKRVKCAWGDNPWVWVVEFKRIAAPRHDEVK